MEYKSFFKYLKEGVEKYLIWEPTGDFRKIVDELDKIPSRPDEVYRGSPDSQVQRLEKTGVLKSSGKDVNTKDASNTFVSDDISLAAAFALRHFRDGHGGHVLIMDRNKLPPLKTRDPGNHTVEYIPKEAVKRIINLQDFTGR